MRKESLRQRGWIERPVGDRELLWSGEERQGGREGGRGLRRRAVFPGEWWWWWWRGGGEGEGEERGEERLMGVKGRRRG